MTNALKHRCFLAVDGLLLGWAVWTWPATARAEPPIVGFDVSYSVECREATPIEFAEANPQSKIVEARFQVSSLLRRGTEKDIKELMYVIWSPEKRLRVLDFEPQTQVGSEVTDSIEVVETEEDMTSLNGSATVRIDPLAGIHVAPSAGASKMKKQHLEQRYSKLPPKHLLLASGTTHREHGVFFKLKPSSQTSLEGQREFVCLFVVPKGWRGDYAYVDCTATPRNRTPWTKPEQYGSRRVLVGLYLQGDAEAREAAERLAYAYEAYLNAGGPAQKGPLEPAKDTGGFLRGFPGLSLVESVIGDFALDDEEAARERDEAWKSFLIALEDLARFTG